MKRSTPLVPILLMLVAGPGSAGRALGADSVGVHVAETAEDKALRITVYPAAEPRPALKYHLLPEFLDRTPGNAAVDYGKVTAERYTVFGSAEWWEENYSSKIDAPLAELRGQEFQLPGIIQTLDRAARRDECDWQVPLREGDFYSVLLNEAQQMRGFARLLGVRARVQIANGRFDEAVHTLQTGYAVGQHVGEGSTLIHGLVGIAASGIMSGRVLELTQQPDAPNLYWALTMLPRPLIDVRRGIEAEMNAVRLTFPELCDLDDATRSPEYWRDSLHQFYREFAPYTENTGVYRPEVLTALVIRGYPIARQALVERGLSPEEVDAMPVPRVVLLHTMQTYEELRDDVFKWSYLPYWEACQRTEQADMAARSAVEGREVIPLARTLLPSIRAVHRAVARSDREIAVLRIIEALRMHAAAHEGRLPEALSDLPVPAPIDPVSGRPFSYRLDGETAVLEGPPLPGLLLHLRIKVARSGDRATTESGDRAPVVAGSPDPATGNDRRSPTS
jgi:hypothetical protein